MPGMRERKLHMMGETKSSRGDYDETKSFMGGGKIKGYKFGGMVRVGTGKAGNIAVEDAVASGPQATKKKKLRKR